MTNTNTTQPIGVLNIDKPQGMSSHDVVNEVRKIANTRRVGHTGTLDPMATGILLILIGNTTRLMEYSHTLRKTYKATAVLGKTSNTDDSTGIIKQTAPHKKPTQQDIQKILQHFQGTIQQIPPAFAAIKVQGKKLYEYARIGEHVERKPRTVTIHSIELISYDYPHMELEITCGSGTYIRAIIRDIGKELDSGAYTSQLCRTRIGKFDIHESIKLNDLTLKTLPKHLMPQKSIIQHLPSLIINNGNVAKLQQGNTVYLEIKVKKETPIALYTTTNNLFGIGVYDDHTSLLHPKKILLN